MNRNDRLAHVLTDNFGIYLSVDDAYCTILGRERSEIIGRGAIGFTSPIERAKHARAIEQLRATGEALVIRKSYVKSDGQLVRVENCASVVSDGIGPNRLIATVRVLPDEAPTSLVERYLRATRQILTYRRTRRGLFGDGRSEWPKWDIALACYQLDCEGKLTTIAAVCRQIGVDIAFGGLNILEMIARADMEMDHRGTTLDDSVVRLSIDYQRIMERYLLNYDKYDPST